MKTRSIRTFGLLLLSATALSAVATAPVLAAPKKKPAATKKAARPSAEAELRALIAAQQAKIDELNARVTAMSAAPAPAPAPAADEEAAANAEFLSAQVDALQAQLDAVKKTTTQITPAFAGAPRFRGTDWAFKVRGTVQFDAGYTSNPGNLINTPNLGFTSRARRLLLGAEGELPGGFRYNAEFNFAGNAVDYEDVVLSYEPAGRPFSITIGHQWPLSSLETMTSNRFTSFLERGQVHEAWGISRRIGVNFGLVNKAGDMRLNLGLFGQPISGNPQSFQNTGWQFSARATYSPMWFGGQFHLGANYQHREFQQNGLGVNYQSRPVTQLTDQRFVSTGNIAGKADDIVGVEFGAIFQALHFAAEGQIAKIDGFRPGTLLPPGSVALGTFLASNPGFTTAYGEVGYFFTGETRGYRNGRWDRTRVLNPFDKGGWGALQGNVRVDYVDLKDNVGGTGTGVVNGVLNGGSQTAYQASVIWIPIDYVRFMLQYAHVNVEGGPLAGTVVPFGSEPLTGRRYSSDSIGLRATLDF
ncbi:OprO/OprP family phosphate-selective porin [Sandaracinobacteroides saxicola]|uniref:Porin n=1 Tax=Sandaracinobacteroides saxicola TaxID=2759707 RepID=A0A7G5IGN8_9SPHN|nr:porin [Sandaracinobacteroides saxicola]QMW22530.1 hypothetical protein H3309_14560 [Sandaracinobacteroides saxicola]